MQRAGRSRVESRKPKPARPGALVGPLLAWFSQNARDLPWRRTRDPYGIWISEIMLQQTQVKTVMSYWPRWMRQLPDARALARARPDRVLKLWEGLGYYRRARNLQKAAQLILERHGGRFPERFADVLALPGIGRYTAGAICSIAFNQPTPVLDGNVIRVLTRIFGIAQNPRRKETGKRLWRLAAGLVKVAAGEPRPEPNRSSAGAEAGPGNCSSFNQALMELGAVICAPRRPKCPLCPVRNQCVAFRENRTDRLPNLGRRIASIKRRFMAFVIERKGRFLVRQRPVGVVNGRLWEFPNLEIERRRPGAGELAEELLGSRPLALRPLHQVRHSITRYRITLEVFRAEFADGLPGPIPQGRWRSPSELDRLAFPSAHRKILRLLQARPRHE